jgi:pimeloyl-ACP methyl ester carboxylesterase
VHPRPRLLPALERFGRYAMNRRGFASRWIDTPLARLHVYDAPGRGTLPTVVLLHGLGSAATPFGGVLARLLPHVKRVVAPDYPGHGFSGTARVKITPESLFDAVEAGVDQLVDEPAIFIGNSLGGALALRYAVDRPAKVRALVLLSPAGARMSDDEWRGLKRSFDVTSARDGISFMDRLYHRPPLLRHAIAREFPALMARPAVRELLESATDDGVAQPDELRALTMPILLLWGQSERLLPASNLAYFREHLPSHAVIEEPHGFGHCPHFDDPAAVTRRIVAFLQGLKA